MSKIMQAALDPSCLLCLTPLGWYSPLRQGVVWPGSPRNFATEPATWYVYYMLVNGFAGNFDLVFDFTATADVVSSAFWHVTSYQNTVNVYAVNTTTYVVRMSPDGTQMNLKEVIINLANFGGLGRHKLTAQKRSDTLSIIFDGGTVFTGTGFGNYYMSAAPQTSCSCIIHEIRFTDAATDKIVWSYPSLSERPRLTTNTNVLIMPGYFGAANPALGWSIKTALPAGLAGTVLAKINGVVVIDSAKWNRTTATFTGLAADTLEWLLVCNATLSAEQIAYLSN